MLKKKVFNKHGRRAGVVVAVLAENNEFGVGWAACNVNKDRFDPAFGEHIAMGRALIPRSVEEELERMPAYLHADYMQMVDRANRYFKGSRPIKIAERDSGLIFGYVPGVF